MWTPRLPGAALYSGTETSSSHWPANADEENYEADVNSSESRLPAAGGFHGTSDREWMGWRTTPEWGELELSAAKEEDYDR